MSVQHWCRACFTPCSDLIPIFDKSKNDEADTIVEVLEALVGHPIQPTEHASNFICAECQIQIREIHPFLVRCKKSDETFQQLGESQVVLRRLDDPIKFVEFVIDEKADDTAVVNTNGYSNDLSFLDLTAESADEIQSDQEEDTATGEDIMECPACLDAFGRVSVLRTHLVEKHTMNSQCIICNNAHFDDIWDHTREHTPRKHECNHCGREFSRLRTLKKHISTHHKETKSLDPNTTEPSETIEIPEEAPPDDANGSEHELRCSVCSKVFTSRRLLYRHELMHLHSASEFACELCGEKYSSKEILDTHMTTHSNNVLNGVSQYYDDSSSLMQLSESLNESSMEPAGGELSYFDQPQIIDLDDDDDDDSYDHMNATSQASYGYNDDEDDDVCLLEPLTTITPNLEYALSTAQIPKQRKPKAYQYECDICSKMFRDRGGLQDHKTIHTGERPFGCQICGKRFRVKRNLREHVISHSNAMPFPCGLCGVRFKKRNAIKQHMLQRHKECDRFPCGLCDSFWPDVDSLARHWKIEHAMSYVDVNVHVKKVFHN